MGDAGPPTPPPILPGQSGGVGQMHVAEGDVREVRVLVTGFGPFKSFLINPSWLIASALPEELHPHANPSKPNTDPPTNTTQVNIAQAYKIRLLIHPHPIRVSYTTITTIVPSLIAQHNPDFILHIGMAGGRDCYSIETRAHRDGYRIKDVDDSDGYYCGELMWKRDNVPAVLECAWDEAEVLRRWQVGVQRGLRERGFLGPGLAALQERPGGGVRMQIPHVTERERERETEMVQARADENRRKAVVKLSRDAGRFLCEFTLFESLSRRWVDVERVRKRGLTTPTQTQTQTQTTADDGESNPDGGNEDEKRLAFERLGKVAFLHVPGWTGVEDVNRGVLVAEEAIRALVGSWEEGFRREGDRQVRNTTGTSTFTSQKSELDAGVAVGWRG